MKQAFVRSLVLWFMMSLAVLPVLAQAQDSTDPADPLAGMTNVVLGSGGLADPDNSTLLLMQMTLAPGTSIPPHRHPGPVVVQIVSGEFQTRFVEGEGQLTRAAESGTPAAEEAMSAGNTYVLNPGDGFFYDGAAHTMENHGEEPVVLLISALFADDQPGFIFLDQATPAS